MKYDIYTCSMIYYDGLNYDFEVMNKARETSKLFSMNEKRLH